MNLDKNSYINLHMWIRYHYGKANHCENNPQHTAKMFEWANIDDIYEKDIKHFKQLCKSCHVRLDFTEESRIKMVRAHKDRPKPWMRKPVRQLDLNSKTIKLFNSRKEASLITGISEAAINNCLKHRSKSAGGYIWI